MLTNEKGFYKILTIKPVSYEVPTDGPVGSMLNLQGRHAWRPSHLHFKVSAEGYQTVVTEIFDEQDPYIEEDAVFGVRESLAVPYKMIESEEEAAHHGVSSPYCNIEFDFGLLPI